MIDFEIEGTAAFGTATAAATVYLGANTVRYLSSFDAAKSVEDGTVKVEVPLLVVEPMNEPHDFLCGEPGAFFFDEDAVGVNPFERDFKRKFGLDDGHSA